MVKNVIKKLLAVVGVKPNSLQRLLAKRSLELALRQNGLGAKLPELRRIVPDVSRQVSRVDESFSDYSELKIRGMHAFQCSLMLRALELMPAGKLTVVDIGDSAGTHMLYLREIARSRFEIDTISVNLDPRAIEKIRARGFEAILCRAEDLDLGDRRINLFTTFEMVEHLHNPAIFFRRLAKKSKCDRMVVTVPYVRRSRVGLAHVRKRLRGTIFAEDEHIFELSPEDWTTLMLHSGWRVADSAVYHQYPRNWPLISELLAMFWRDMDFQGFWGAILEKDTTFSDYYQDWED